MCCLILSSPVIRRPRGIAPLPRAGTRTRARGFHCHCYDRVAGFGTPWGTLGAKKSSLERLLAKTGFSNLGGQKAPAREAKRVQHRV